jgi:hypothetical protein
MDGRRVPDRWAPTRYRQEEHPMTTPTSGLRLIEISEEAFDILARTAATQGTDFDGALRYLMQVPAVPTTRRDEDLDENE